MALRKLLILRRPPLQDAAGGGSSGQGGGLEGRTEAQSGHPSICAGMRGRGSFIFQPKREVLLQICCRCSHWQQSVQFMIAGPWSRRVAEYRMLHPVARCDAEACRGAAVELDHRPNRCGGGNHIE